MLQVAVLIRWGSPAIEQLRHARDDLSGVWGAICEDHREVVGKTVIAILVPPGPGDPGLWLPRGPVGPPAPTISAPHEGLSRFDVL